MTHRFVPVRAELNPNPLGSAHVWECVVCGLVTYTRFLPQVPFEVDGKVAVDDSAGWGDYTWLIYGPEKLPVPASCEDWVAIDVMSN